MELKCVSNASLRSVRVVLIIPYGIEICLDIAHFGILYVLIIPYGIEIRMRVPQNKSTGVLIIPYGIEMKQYLMTYRQCTECFNHTLWN